MKITREIFDNDKKIVHINYQAGDIKNIKKRITKENRPRENTDVIRKEK